MSKYPCFVLFLTILDSNALNITSLPPLEVIEQEEITTRPPLLVTTQYGLVQGITLMAYRNETVSAFLGVPYAEPPVGGLRFESPKDHHKWNGVWKANRQPPSCMQMPDLKFGNFEGKHLFEFF